MYFPVITPHLYKRKGGGGGGSGGHGSGSSGGHGSGGGRGGGGGGSSSHSTPVHVSGETVGRGSADAYGSGSKKIITIPSGRPFAGRTSGGGTRDSVYGTPYYGSGYPGVPGPGVSNRGFPFVFWPFVWGVGLGYGAEYLHTHEYGDPNNSSRPGGPLTQEAISSSVINTTFHVLADNTTVTALTSSIIANCSSISNFTTTPSPPSAFNGAATDPLPEQAIQYYRASTVVLTLDGYNNTAALTGDQNAPPQPLPSNIDTALLDCLNSTIGQSVPLFSSAQMPVPHFTLVALAYVLWCLSSLL